jgi:putative flippase GtrA
VISSGALRLKGRSFFSSPLLRQFFRFSITGSLGAAIDFGLYSLLTRFFHWPQGVRIGFVTLMPANLVSVLTAIVVMFFINKYWTFEDRRQEIMLQQGLGFLGFYLTTYMLNQILTTIFAFYVPTLRVIFGEMTDLAAKALAIGIILFINFAGNKLLIFRKT